MNHSSEISRAQIEALIAGGRLSVHFQPIVDLHDGLVVAYEALTRVAPESGIRNVGDLFHAAEAHGLIWALEAATRANAIRAAADWPRGTRLFLNSTPAVFADDRFAEALLQDLVHAPDLTPDRIVLEITELSEDLDLPNLSTQVARLTAAGFQVALDDAGAGTSGLNRMMAIRPQWVKLDREFVQGIDGDTLRQNLVRFFVHFARLSGVSVIAEGIEQASELETVTSLGVRYAQGYYLAKPGTREQTMDPSFISDMRTRWAAVEAAVPQETVSPTLQGLARSARIAPPDTTVSQARTWLEQEPDAAGVIVAEHGQVVGWCARRDVFGGGDRRNNVTLGRCASRNFISLQGDTGLDDALHAILDRDPDNLPDPVIVMNGSQVRGVVRLRDALRIAATEWRLAVSGRGAVTGLPNRAVADQHLTGIVRRWRDQGVNTVDAPAHADAAFVDIRGFSEFNLAHGRWRGDQLMRELAEMISAVVLSAVPGSFVSHLGDDRFLITAPNQTLGPRMQLLADAFDDQCGSEHWVGAVPTLRVLVLDGVLPTCSSSRDVYRREQKLRERSRAEGHETAATRSIVLIETPDSHDVRRAA